MVRAVGVAAETTGGEYVAPDYHFDPLSESVQLNENTLIPDTISTRTGRRAFLTHQDSSGQVEFILDTTVASYFLSAVCGQSTTSTGATTIELVPTAERKTLPSISLTINSLYFLRKIAGAGIKRVTIRSDGGPGNLPSLQAEFVGGTETKDAPDANINVASFSAAEAGKVLANTTGFLYLADDDLVVVGGGTGGIGLIKTKSFEIVIEPTFKEDPIIGIGGLDPELYYPENWKITVNVTIPNTAANSQWFARYMGSQQDTDADGLLGATTRVWDFLNQTGTPSFPLQFKAFFSYDTDYDLEIDVENAVIIGPVGYSESGKTISDVTLSLEALHYEDTTDKTFQAVIGNSSAFTGALLPGDETP
jgi:hypothetical protein